MRKDLIMASNSDSIYYVLTKIQRHPELVVAERARYTNTLMLVIDDHLKIADAAFYFPDNRLMVNRLSNDFVAKNDNLLEGYFHRVAGGAKSYHNVWVTTSHITAQQAYLLELSFE